jgi:hypothetical protein
LPRRFEYPDTTNDDFVEWSDKQHGHIPRDNDEFMNLFIQVQATYTDQQWPERADLMSFDVGLHMGFLTSISKEEPSGLKRNEEGSVRERTSQTSQAR